MTNIRVIHVITIILLQVERAGATNSINVTNTTSISAISSDAVNDSVDFVLSYGPFVLAVLCCWGMACCCYYCFLEEVEHDEAYGRRKETMQGPTGIEMHLENREKGGEIQVAPDSILTSPVPHVMHTKTDEEGRQITMEFSPRHDAGREAKRILRSQRDQREDELRRAGLHPTEGQAFVSEHTGKRLVSGME